MRHRTLSWGALLVVALLVAACGSGASQTSGPPAHPTLTSVPSTPTPTPLPQGVSAAIPGLGTVSGHDFYALAADDTAVWVYNPDTGNVLRIDPKTNTLVATISVGQGCAIPGPCGNVALGDGAVWVAKPATGTIVRIDPKTNLVVATITLPSGAQPYVAVAPGAVWSANRTLNSYSKIDPQTNQVVATLTNQFGAAGLTYSQGSLWLCNFNGHPSLSRLDPTTYQVQAQIAPASYHSGCFFITATAQDIWTMTFNGNGAFAERIDQATNQVIWALLMPGNYNGFLAAGAEGVWYLNDAGLFRFATPSESLSGPWPGVSGVGLAVGAGSVWVASLSGTLLRITPTV